MEISSSSNTDRSESAKIGLLEACMRTYGLFQLQTVILCAPFFLSKLENINAVETNCRETLFVTESCSSGKIYLVSEISSSVKEHRSE